MKTEVLDQICTLVIDGDKEQIKEKVDAALQEGIAPLTILNEALVKGIEVVGSKFESGEFFLPDLMMGSDAMQAGLACLEPHFATGEGRKKLGKVVVGTVAGDMHFIGKNIVVNMLQAAGFEVTDLGVDVATETFIQAVKEHRPDILGLSALMTMTLPKQIEVIEQLQEEGLRDKVFVMVGGAPVTQEWCDKIGADAYGENAITTVNKAKALIANKK